MALAEQGRTRVSTVLKIHVWLYSRHAYCVFHRHFVLSGEEVLARKQSLHQLVESLANLVQARHDQNKHFGVVLLPEGLIEFIPEVSCSRVSLEDSREVRNAPFLPSSLALQEVAVKFKRASFSPSPDR